MNAELFRPFAQIAVQPPKQWHPWLVHFPLVFLELEAFFLAWSLVSKRPELERRAWAFLKAGFWSSLVVAATGFHDAGLLCGPGNPFLLGLRDRLQNYRRFDMLVTVHFWLASLLVALVAVRFGWRASRGPLRGAAAWAYAGLALAGIWCLLAMSYAGGMMYHD
ncbi:MAG TPA: DUF2231 domain-containing protein [Candidatus Eisenbacteria bacterium]|nr:DUF2231 domain-containing protein [Candidatus Eisenbacteria bacterium]